MADRNRYGSKIQIDSDICANLKNCSMETGLSMTEIGNRILRKRMAEKRTLNPLEADMEIPEMASMGSKPIRTVLINPDELELVENPEDIEYPENEE